MIRIIAGISLDRAIGVYETKKGKLPWGLKEARGDLALFRAVTDGDAVIMGRKTFESIGSKPLANRTNIVVTSGNLDREGIHVARSVSEAIGLAELGGAENVWIMGGTAIFREAMEYADEIFLTVVPFKAYKRYTPAKLVYFPAVDVERFGIRQCETHPINSRLRIIRYGTSEIRETIDDLRRAYQESSEKTRSAKPKKQRGSKSNRKASPRSKQGKNQVVEAVAASDTH